MRTKAACRRVLILSHSSTTWKSLCLQGVIAGCRMSSTGKCEKSSRQNSEALRVQPRSSKRLELSLLVKAPTLLKSAPSERRTQVQTWVSTHKWRSRAAWKISTHTNLIAHCPVPSLLKTDMTITQLDELMPHQEDRKSQSHQRRQPFHSQPQGPTKSNIDHVCPSWEFFFSMRKHFLQRPLLSTGPAHHLVLNTLNNADGYSPGEPGMNSFMPCIGLDC